MGKSIGRRVGAIVGLGFLLAACSGSRHTPIPDDGSGGAISFGNGGNGGYIPGIAGAPSPSLLCSPGTKRCDGLSVKACDDTGSQEIVAQTCLPSQICSNAACVGSVCPPNTEFCKDGAVWQCDSSGGSTRGEQCQNGLFCRVDGDRASCSTQACTPNQPVCDGDIATTCKSDGSGPTSGGVDCGGAKQACYAGQCHDAKCSNGSKLCDHGDVYLCSHNGTDIALLTDCSMGEVCDANAGACRAKICDPGKLSCDGSRVQTCNEFGSAWLPVSDCATDGKVCAAGSCKKQICAASRGYCQDGNVYSCDASGTTGTLTQLCNTQDQHCVAYGSFASCSVNDCHAGDKLCANNVIKVCNADGTLPASGTPCADTQFCDNAQCKDRLCEPYTYFCKGKDIYYCDFNNPVVSQQCAVDSSCKVLGGTGATCAPLNCSPSSSACLGNQIGTCAADGQSLSQVTSDCAAASSVCTADLKCAQSATDELGKAENVEPLSASYVIGDVIDVGSARKLTELQTQLVLGGPRELRWIVYELSGQTFVAKVDKVVSNVTGSGFISSGPFNFTLSAGKRYMLGVVISGGDAVGYLDTSPYVSKLSFGALTGRVVSYYPGSFDVYGVDPNYVSVMTVTTELP
jgi:hypothetical protein